MNAKRIFNILYNGYIYKTDSSFNYEVFDITNSNIDEKCMFYLKKIAFNEGMFIRYEYYPKYNSMSIYIEKIKQLKLKKGDK